MKTLTTTAALAALAWLPPTSTAGAQEAKTTTIEEVIAEFTITIEEALEALQRDDNGSWASSPASRLLRQEVVFGITVNPLPEAELDAFADRLAAMALDPTLQEHVRDNARSALVGATTPGATTPYLRAFDLLVQVHEGGYDVLGSIFSADPERGPAYVRGVFERSERPPVCRWRYDGDRGWQPLHGVSLDRPECWRDARPTPWCRAGDLLFRDIVSEARERTPKDRLRSAAGWPQPMPDGLPEHVEDWHRRCR